jgi:ferric-dicitrate binding protein FerR (iron transport regulator)
MSERPLSDRDRQHFDACLRCQAEAANYRVIARTLRSMRNSDETAPPGLVLRVMANLSRPLTERRRGLERIVVVVSVVVVAAAMALLGRSRLRPVN